MVEIYGLTVQRPSFQWQRSVCLSFHLLTTWSLAVAMQTYAVRRPTEQRPVGEAAAPGAAPEVAAAAAAATPAVDGNQGHSSTAWGNAGNTNAWGNYRHDSRGDNSKSWWQSPQWGWRNRLGAGDDARPAWTSYPEGDREYINDRDVTVPTFTPSAGARPYKKKVALFQQSRAAGAAGNASLGADYRCSSDRTL